MAENLYNRINDYGSVKISLASPEDIRSWSYGEVKKPETINYRTYRPERDGLFCERIFGPERDWECACGKYKGIKHKGIVCDKCGVMVTHSRVRRKRMGHINLAAPVAHIWFFKAMPSRLGTLLDMKTSNLERVVYFQDYIVIDPGDTPLEEKQLLTEEEYRQSRAKYGTEFDADMGAEAVKKMLRRLDLQQLSQELREELLSTRSKQRQKDIIKRLKTVEMLRDSGNQADWMILEVIPVIPPDLRPLVLLDSGNFATSDLNDLYRRLINRNNRLKKLLDLNAPEVIIRNEKRMLQQSVDALFDNGRCRRPVLGSSNRPLKSLTDMIKGKQGRFRENLLGKRVDYSARSVIVVGPELRLHQCGLPKKVALELFQPFIIRRLKELGLADTIKSAKRMLERRDEEVWDILDEVIRDHPVLLNRAPTLHRMGIQAFEPVLIEGNAIRLHPLVCSGFNADFDGDQMAVHLPLSFEAQIEAATLMLATNNIFSPANGAPIIAPSQDMVLGIFYLTKDPHLTTKPQAFSSLGELFLAYGHGLTHTHHPVKVRMEPGTQVKMGQNDSPVVVGDDGKIPFVDEETGEERRDYLPTTIGRAIFNDILPPGMPFYGYQLNKKGISGLISDCHRLLGRDATLTLLDDLKDLGFKSSTRAGLSFAKDDMRIPESKQAILDEIQAEIDQVEVAFQKGVITDGERYLKVIDLWTHARERVGAEMMGVLAADQRGDVYVNPIFCMVTSGARGSLDQIRQLAGMRGLMAKPSGKIIETPIKANFREGLKVLEYFSSTHGARKGLADTALKTADAGYLTRKLTDVAQNVVISSDDCGTPNGVFKVAVYKGEKVVVSLSQAIRGRVARDTIMDVATDEVVVRENEIITESAAARVEALGFEKVRLRSPLTCEAGLGICARCYGMDLSRGTVAERGLAVGIIAAQSIGEPGTQLTMRTFHIGGTASRSVEESEVKVKRDGKVRFANLQVVTNPDGEDVALNRQGEVLVMDDRDRELDRYVVPIGSIIARKDGEDVVAGDVLCSWDPHQVPILAEFGGKVRYEDLIEGKTLKVERDARRGAVRKQVMEHKGDLHPQLILEDKNGEPLALYPIPERAYIEVDDGASIKPGGLLAKTAREIGGTQDITGGLPRVTELFEARRPKDPSVISEIDGFVELGDKKRGKRTIIVRAIGEEGEVIEEVEHAVPQGKHLRVHKGNEVKAGDPLVDGPLVPQDILRINGEELLQDYLLDEIQNVYRSQGVGIDDKHIEIIISQMMRKVQVNDPGDSDFLPGAVVDKFRFRRQNEQLRKERKKPATGMTLLLGVTKASLSSESFISAASFQETTKVLTEAAMAGKRDYLVGLKENVILGHMVPTGTGFRDHYRTRVKKNIDFGEIGKGFGTSSTPADADIEALLSGNLEALTGRASTSLAPTGTGDATADMAELLRIGSIETAVDTIEGPEDRGAMGEPAAHDDDEGAEPAN
ncbi:DNA-directed RNA polymerase subunit beta' [Engelhardtia mirabilis]|uniref:DNA-directed RNA polymerase subunit beta' n=1 Tax=Engelhardtia mirabilis TaxID=2528011 RepID=A0A518BPE7_9BACT|nr:DNA-directed RNA polymerase subunit beta' [Planctomycetes bacterium Pla133]QDV03172.1 DNA-directed RNA polymerase subunit beta' [Planctomycetes bacterium Pla86]